MGIFVLMVFAAFTTLIYTKASFIGLIIGIVLLIIGYVNLQYVKHHKQQSLISKCAQKPNPTIDFVHYSANYEYGLKVFDSTNSTIETGGSDVSQISVDVGGKDKLPEKRPVEKSTWVQYKPKHNKPKREVAEKILDAAAASRQRQIEFAQKEQTGDLLHSHLTIDEHARLSRGKRCSRHGGDRLIYVHKRASDGIPFYIGLGTIRRANDFRSRNSHWKSVYAMHGCKVEILIDGLTTLQASEIEKELISEYRSRYPTYMTNISNGGGTGSRKKYH